MANKRSATKNHRVVVIILAILAILVATLMVGLTVVVHKLSNTSDLADSTAIRELVIQAAKDTKKPAPVDAKTGDIYFPEARLYLTQDKNLEQNSFIYTYNHDSATLHISTTTALNQATAGLYSAQNSEEVFDAVPKLQSCSRGITVTPKALTAFDYGEKLALTVSTDDGRLLHSYTENLCQELHALTDELGVLKSY